MKFLAVLVKRIKYFAKVPDYVLFDLIFNLKAKYFEKESIIMDEN